MSEVMSKFQPEDFAGLVSVVGGMVIFTVAIIAWFWHKTRKLEIQAALKQDMLNRGMSADEIQTVIESGAGCCGASYRNRRSLRV